MVTVIWLPEFAIATPTGGVRFRTLYRRLLACMSVKCFEAGCTQPKRRAITIANPTDETHSIGAAEAIIFALDLILTSVS